MSVINPSSPGANVLNSSALGKNELTQESFMKLLLTQLKMQNPLNPFDASTMMQQMSQLTGLSATQDLVKTVDAFKSSLGTSQVLEASMLVGKEVQVRSQSMQLTAAREGKASVMVPQGVDAVEVSILDAAGNPIKKIQLNAPSEGLLDFSWNGLDEQGKAMEPGFYSFSAQGMKAGELQALPTAASMRVNSVALDRNSGIVILNVDGLGGVSMTDVVKIC